MGYHHQLYQQNRHNNTPHTNENDQNIIINAYNDTPHELIPERIRLLLDRYAVNGFLQSNAPPPANKILIDNIPESHIDEHFIETHKHNTECAICKIHIKMYDTIKTLQCKHYFHSKCIVTWLNIHASCPLCRHRLNADSTTPSALPNTPTMAAEDAQTRSMLNRLQDLRRRRRSRRTLRNQTRSNSTSGNRTPINRNNRRNTNTNAAAANGDMQQAATQLINAVTQILDQWNTQQTHESDPQRVVRFREDGMHHNNAIKRLKRFMSSPRPSTRTPHSSRSNTQTITTLPELPLSPLSPTHHALVATRQRDHSLTSQKSHASPPNSPAKVVLNAMNNISITSPGLMPHNNTILHQSTLSEDNELDDEERHNQMYLECEEEPISANRIKQDFSKWNRKRRSRLDSIGGDEIKMNNGNTIIYNSNYNQNYIYNNNYNQQKESLCENDLLGSERIFSSNATTPSPAPPVHAMRRMKHNNSNNSQQNGKAMPAYNTQMGTELSNQTMVIKSGQTSPNPCLEEDIMDEEMMQMMDMMDGYDEGCNDELFVPNDEIYSFMSEQQLETAKAQHQSIIDTQQRIMQQIQQEKNKRLLNAQWTCPVCMKNERAFLFLPCRHLGLCTKCNVMKVSKAMRCYTCNCVIQQKIPINFNPD
eukprot:207698_1